jgi:hypothetical protein
MSRIHELKLNNPSFTIDIIGIINELFSKSKYAELSVNLIKTRKNSFQHGEGQKEDLITELSTEFELDEKMLSTKSVDELETIRKIITEQFGFNNFLIMKKFEKLNERNLIINNDLTRFKIFEDIELELSLAEFKLLGKELEKQTIKLLENEEWLVIKPMSFLASKKYGANTKWCTTQEHNPEYYLRYSKRGILIYCINKKTGDKVAAFKNTDKYADKETSFWDITDNRVDSMECNLPQEVMDIIKDEFKNTTKSNWELLSDEERNSQLFYIETHYYNKKKTSLLRNPVGDETEIYEEADVYQEEVGYVSEEPVRPRIISFRPHETTLNMETPPID